MIRKLFPEEFVIDEKPLAVLHWVAIKPPPEEAMSMAASTERYFGGSRRQDLLSQLSAMMVEQVMLADRARKLEQRGAGDDEFGRFVRAALPFLDNFARLLDLAREHPPSEEVTSWLASVEGLYFRIVRLLEEYGLRFINSVGKPVDLDYHEVVEYRPSDQYPHDLVVKELQKGVVFRNRLIRDAKVVVACNEKGP